MRLRLPFIHQAFRPQTSRKRPGNGGFIQMVRNFPPFQSDGKRGVPLKVLHNLRTEFPENYLSIWLQTRFFLPNGPGGGVLPYMSCIGMCRCEGYGFERVYSRIGYRNQSSGILRTGFAFVCYCLIRK